MPRHDFGASLKSHKCATCNMRIWNRGCRSCEHRFCRSCFEDHMQNSRCAGQRHAMNKEAAVIAKPSLAQSPAGVFGSPVQSPAREYMSQGTGQLRIYVNSLAGEYKVITISASENLETLYQRVSAVFGVHRAEVMLIAGDRFFTTPEAVRTLESMDIVDETNITFVRQAFIQVEEGLELTISDAGSMEINGTYSCVLTKDACPNLVGHAGPLVFKQTGGSHRITWWRAEAHGRWPAGWYFETANCYGVYFHRSHESSRLPRNLWEPYVAAAWSTPGKCPGPGVSEVE